MEVKDFLTAIGMVIILYFGYNLILIILSTLNAFSDLLTAVVAAKCLKLLPSQEEEPPIDTNCIGFLIPSPEEEESEKCCGFRKR